MTYSPDGYSVTIEVKDGGFGDFDGPANGTIVESGGIILKKSATPDANPSSFEPSITPDTQEQEASGGSGGCFITDINFNRLKIMKKSFF